MMDFQKIEQRVTWFAFDKEKFQSIFEDALNEMNLDAKDSRHLSSFETSDSLDPPQIKVEKEEGCNHVFEVEETALRQIKSEVKEEPKLEIVDYIPPSKDLSDSLESCAEFSDFRIIRGSLVSTDAPDKQFAACPKRAVTPELSRRRNMHSLKRSHSASNIVPMKNEIPPPLNHPNVTVDVPGSAKERELGGELKKVLVASKKNFISIDNILGRGNDDFLKKSGRQSIGSDGFLDSTILDLKYYDNGSKSSSIFNSFPVRCGWFGMDKKIFSGIVDTLSQMYFDNLKRTELVGLNGSKFSITNNPQSIQNYVTRNIDFNRQKSWNAGSFDFKRPRSSEYYFQSTHSKPFKDRFHLSRLNNTDRSCFNENEKSHRSSKMFSRTSSVKGKNGKRKEKVLNSSCVSSTMGSPRKDGISPNKSGTSCQKSLGKESWIRVDKSIVNGMVDFLVGQLYPEFDLSRKHEIKQSSEKSSDTGDLTSDRSNDVINTVLKVKEINANPSLPIVKGTPGDRKNYSIGFLSKSDSRDKKKVEGEMVMTAHDANEETPRENKTWDTKPTQTDAGRQESKDCSSSASYWNYGTPNNLKEAILT